MTDHYSFDWDTLTTMEGRNKLMVNWVNKVEFLEIDLKKNNFEYSVVDFRNYPV